MSFDEIARCAVEYAELQQQLDRSEQAEDRDRLDATEQLLAARLRLAHCLVRAGWTPDAEVAATLGLDRAVLAEPVGGGCFTPSQTQLAAAPGPDRSANRG